MLTPPGHNSQSFNPLVPESNFVAEVSASSADGLNKIRFKVSAHHKEVVKRCLEKSAVGAVEIDLGSHGTWFQVIDLVDIKKSLDRLHERRLITEDFYQTIVTRFPKAYGGTLDLSSVMLSATPIIQIDMDLEDIFARSMALLECIPEFQSETITAINETQKNILEGTLRYVFEDIRGIDPARDALKVMKLINQDTEITEDQRVFLEQYDCLNGVEFIRKILKHPHPQNRATGDPTTGEGPEGIKEGRVYYWNNGFGTGVSSEPQGLLGLSARNDGTTPPITRESTVTYINSLIKKEKGLLVERSNREFEILVNKTQKEVEKLAPLILQSKFWEQRLQRL